LWPLSNENRRAAHTTAGINSAGTYQRARLRISSLPAMIDMPGRAFTIVSRYACRNEKTPSTVATPNTHAQGGVHTFRMRAVS
jgi:hypothetical protein